MCPHLHVHKKKHSSLYSAQNLQFCEISQSHTEPTFHKLDVAGLVQCVESLTDCRMKGHGFDSWDRTDSQGLKDDVTRDDSQRPFLAQHSVAKLEQRCNYSKQCRNNVATLCCAKNRRCESSRVTSPQKSWEMKVLPFHCKRLDHRVARMTTENGDPFRLQ